eukprot:2117498-Amphidinium_carterae.1
MKKATRVLVEEHGLVLWNALPADCAALVPEPGREFTHEEVTTHAIVVNGLMPGKEFLLRAWVANDVGFNNATPPA